MMSLLSHQVPLLPVPTNISLVAWINAADQKLPKTVNELVDSVMTSQITRNVTRTSRRKMASAMVSRLLIRFKYNDSN